MSRYTAPRLKIMRALGVHLPVFRAGFAPTVMAARQMVSDGRQHPEIRLCAADLMQLWDHTATLLAAANEAPSAALH